MCLGLILCAVLLWWFPLFFRFVCYAFFMSIILSVITAFEYAFPRFWHCVLSLFDCMIFFLGSHLKIFYSPLLLVCALSEHLAQLSWLASFFNSSLVCFSVNLYVYLSYPHFVIFLLFFLLLLWGLALVTLDCGLIFSTFFPIKKKQTVCSHLLLVTIEENLIFVHIA